MLAVVLTALLSAAPARAPSRPPTPAALHRALEATAHAWVDVSGSHGHGAGLTVGRDGEILAPVSAVDLERAHVRAGKRRSSARVLAASAYLGTALLRPDHPLSTHPVTVDAHAAIPSGGWLIAVARKGHPFAVRVLSAPAGSPFLELADNLRVGTALFASSGALVAFVVRRKAATSRAVLVSAVRTQLAPVAAQDAP